MEGAPGSIVLCCPECATHYDWVTPVGVCTARDAPCCPECALPFPMECRRCGLDLTVDGFSARRRKRRDDDPEGPRAWDLFCPECAASYDVFAAGDKGVKPCAKCGEPVPAGELRLRTENETEIVGPVSLSRTEYLGLCPACAQGADTGSGRTFTILVVVFSLVGLLGMVACLVN